MFNVDLESEMELSRGALLTLVSHKEEVVVGIGESLAQRDEVELGRGFDLKKTKHLKTSTTTQKLIKEKKFLWKCQNDLLNLLI
jgi:hypothetical protein